MGSVRLTPAPAGHARIRGTGGAWCMTRRARQVEGGIVATAADAPEDVRRRLREALAPPSSL